MTASSSTAPRWTRSESRSAPEQTRSRTVSASQARSYVAKANEYLTAAANELDAGRSIAATSLAIHAAINAAYAVTGMRIGRRAAGQGHDAALKMLREAGQDGAEVERNLGSLGQGSATSLGRRGRSGQPRRRARVPAAPASSGSSRARLPAASRPARPAPPGGTHPRTRCRTSRTWLWAGSVTRPRPPAALSAPCRRAGAPGRSRTPSERGGHRRPLRAARHRAATRMSCCSSSSLARAQIHASAWSRSR